MSTITAANSVFTLSIPDVFPTPQQLQGYATDDAFASENVEPAEAMMGVDGLMSAGFTPFPTKITIAFMADSPSIQIMESWLGAMKAAQEVFFADASILLPSVSKAYACTKGALTGAKQFPDAKKVLQAVQYVITWESVVPAPVPAPV
jgi:hypothetical protein